MKYVSDIALHGKSVNGILYPTYGADFTVTVRDTNSDKVEVLTEEELYGGIYGVIFCVSIVKQSKLSCKLSEHIELHDRVTAMPRDTYFVDANSLFKAGAVPLEDTMLDIISTEYSVKVNSSGVVRESRGSQKLYSLYDWLMLMCKQTGRNIFAYKAIKFSGLHSWSSSIVCLRHNEEADKFYNKLYILGTSYKR